MTEPIQHAGGCHCGAVRYQVALDPSQPVIACNCSMCQRMGSLFAFVPAERFTLVSGEDTLTDYQFNKKVIHHLFCSRCGIRSFARGTSPEGSPMVAINARCLDDVSPEQLTIHRFDGRSI